MTVSIWIYILGINFALELHDSMQRKAHGNSMELRDISLGHKMASIRSNLQKYIDLENPTQCTVQTVEPCI